MTTRSLLPIAALLLATPAALAITVGKLDFQRCELPGSSTGDPIAAYCSTQEVPLAYADPGKGTIKLHIAYLPARDAQAQQTPVVFLAGGPGQAASDSFNAVAGALHRVNEAFPLVFFDQRGTGLSSPLECDLGETGNELEVSEEDSQALLAELKSCLEKLPYDPRYFTTGDAVADLEWVRERMGYQQLNLYGVSYGTRLAQRYLKSHPTRVRSVVLDGVVPPELVLGQSFAQTLDAALAKLDRACEKDLGCKALGGLQARLARLKSALNKQQMVVRFNHPRSGEAIDQTLSMAALGMLVRMYAYSPETYALLPQTLAQAEAGNAAPLLSQAILIGERMRESIGLGVQLSVVCSEDAPMFAAEVPKEEASFLGALIANQMRAMCELWPRLPAPGDFHSAMSSETPALFLSGEFDPVTPPEFAQQASKGWGKARHLIAPGQGHHVLPRGCMSRLTEEFLRTLNPASLDVACLKKLRAAPFFINNNGAAP